MSHERDEAMRQQEANEAVIRMRYPFRGINRSTGPHPDPTAQVREQHNARVTELLLANNREVERRRAAEAEVRRLNIEYGILRCPERVWRGECGHLWYRDDAHKECPVCAVQDERDEARSILNGFRNLGFRPCKDPTCYRPTLDMMHRADAALCDFDAPGYVARLTALQAVRVALARFEAALARREHGDVAAWKFVHAMRAILSSSAADARHG